MKMLLNIWAGEEEKRRQKNYTKGSDILTIYFFLFIIIAATSCNSTENNVPRTFLVKSNNTPTEVGVVQTPKPLFYKFTADVLMKDYLDTISRLAERFDTLLDYTLDEHSIVHSNPWLLDSLIATDYYSKKEEGIIVKDILSWVIIHEGDSLIIPDSLNSNIIQKKIASIKLDINIPEYRLRIIIGDTALFSIPIRVGRPVWKYLAMVDKKVNLMTKTGKGKIVKIDKNPTYINPADNRIYKMTRRDDGIITQLPRIPWMEPELGEIRHGQWIHPTTNKNTLEKAYSNGCIGVSEGDMWRIYYHSKIGTPITIRYDLEVNDENGERKILKNIYPSMKRSIAQIVPVIPGKTVDVPVPLCSCM